MYEMHVVVRVGVIKESFRKLLKEGVNKGRISSNGEER